MMRVPIELRDVYGRPLRYLLDPEQSRAFELLTGRITLRDTDIHALEAFGCSVEEGESS